MTYHFKELVPHLYFHKVSGNWICHTPLLDGFGPTWLAAWEDFQVKRAREVEMKLATAHPEFPKYGDFFEWSR